MSSRPASSRPPIYGLMAEFSDPNELIAAIRQARAGGYRRMDAYTPYPIEEVAHELGIHGNHLPKLVLAGGIERKKRMNKKKKKINIR